MRGSSSAVELEAVIGGCLVCGAPGRGAAHRHQRAEEEFVSCGQVYCESHGGEARGFVEARERAGGCYFFQAPPALTRAQVIEGARTQLLPEHIYVVLRQAGGRWLVSLGRQLPDRYSYDSKLEAERAGVGAWRASYAKRLGEILAARGGDLSWGPPVARMDAPLVLEAGLGGGRLPFASARSAALEALSGEIAMPTSARERQAVRKVRETGRVVLPHVLRELLRRDEELGGRLADGELLRAALRRFDSEGA